MRPLAPSSLLRVISALTPRMAKRAALILLLSSATLAPVHAAQWMDVATISSTLTNTKGRLCVGGGRTDIGCPTNSPLLDSAAGLLTVPGDLRVIGNLYVSGSQQFDGVTFSNGGVSATGTVTATTFSGSGAGLSNIPASGIVGLNLDRIVSDSANVVAGNGGTISFTTGGVSGTAYIDTTGRFVAAGVSTTGGISGSTGYFNTFMMGDPTTYTAPFSPFGAIGVVQGNNNGISGIDMRNRSAGASGEFRFMVSDNLGTNGSYIAFSMPSSANNSTLFGQPRNNIAAVFVNNGTGAIGTPGRNLVLGTVNAGHLIFGANNAEAARITSNGLAGFGTQSPTTKVDISGTLKIANSGETCDTTRLGAIRYTSSQFQICQTAASGWEPLATATSTTTLSINTGVSGSLVYRNEYGVLYATNTLSISSTTGSVGIGAGAPAYLGNNALYVAGSIRADGSVNVIDNNKVSWGQANTYFDGSSATPSHYIRAVVNNTEALRIVSTGYVGIGIATPTTALNVSGTLRIANGGESCDASRIGAIKYQSSAFYICQNTTNGWEALATTGANSLADRITSNSQAGVIANQTGYISLTTGGVTGTAYFTPGGVYVGGGISTTGGISGTTGYFSKPVGIGTATAKSLLDVNTGSSASASNYAHFGANTGVNPTTYNPYVAGEAGIYLGYNRSSGNGEANLIYGMGGGSNPGLAIGSWDSTTYKETLRIVSTGLVGIGTSDPSTALQVSGTLRIASGGEACDASRTGAIRFTAGQFYICRNGTTWETIVAGSSGSVDTDRITSGTTSVITSNNTSVTISTNNVQRVIIGTNGEIGVAQQPVAGQALSISGTSAITGRLNLLTATGNNLLIGNNAGTSNSGQFITAIGQGAAQNNTGNGLTALGYGAGAGNTQFNVVAIGTNALGSNTGAQTAAIGYNAGQFNTGDYVMAMGNNAAQYNSGANLTAIGVGAGNINTGINNIAIGTNSLGNHTAGGNNVSIGHASGIGVSGSSVFGGGVMIGSYAGQSLTSGNSNTLLGYSAGATLTTGSNNIAIGNQTNLLSNTGSNQLNIGNAVWGDIASGLGNTNLIGINTSTPSTSLHVSGTLRIADGGESCDANRIGAMKYSGGAFYICQNTSNGWEPIATAGPTSLADRITSNSQAGVIANATGYISLTTGGVTGTTYFTPGGKMVTRDISLTGTISATTLSLSENGYIQTLTGTRHEFKTPSSYVASIATDESSLFQFSNGGLPRLTIRDTGLIGISTSTPSATLHVNGTIRMADGGEACDANRLGAIKYTAGTFYICQNTSNGWEAIASAASGTTRYASLTDIVYSAANGNLTGPGSFTSASTGNNNVAFGPGAAVSMTSGAHNVAIGSKALATATNNDYNVAIGSSALGKITSGLQNITIGYNSMANTTTGSYNTATGLNALNSNTIGAYNTGFGYRTLETIANQSYSTAVGAYALRYARGGYNTAIGYNAGLGGAASVFISTSTFVGAFSGQSLNASQSNTLIGYAAGGNLTSGNNNIAIGSEVTPFSNTGSNQLNLGNVIWGDIGSGLGNLNKIGINTPTPTTALDVSGTIKMADGGEACDAARLGAIKYSANQFYICRNATTWETITAAASSNGYTDRIISGTAGVYANQSGSSVSITTSGVERVLVNASGYVGINQQPSNGIYLSVSGTTSIVGRLGLTTPNNTYNVITGSFAGSSLTGTYNAVYGYTTGQNNTGSNNALFGTYAGQNNTGSGAVAIGYAAGQANTGSSTVLIGNVAGQNNSGPFTTSIGNAAGQYNTGTNLTAVGASTAQSNTGINVSAYGFSAAQYNTGGYVTAIGQSAAYSNTGLNLTALGYSAAYNNTAANITSVGTNSMLYHTSGANNAAFGFNAGLGVNAASTYADSTLLGAYAGQGLTSGNSNTLIGYNAGGGITTGSNNLVIGTNLSPFSNTGSYQLNIANAIWGNTGSGTGNANRIGINVTSPTANLEVSGTVSATRFVGDGSMLTGISASSISGLSSDNITSGTSNVTVNNNGAISFTTAGTQRMAIAANGTIGIGQAPLAGTAFAVTGLSSFTGRVDILSAAGHNMFVGAGAGYFNTGTYNTGLGENALQNGGTGNYNTAVGNAAGFGSNGNYVTAVGYQSANLNTGSYVTALGSGAAQNNKASYVIAIGQSAAIGNQTSGTTAVGYSALTGNTTGLANTAVGYNSLVNVTTGSYNTSLGYSAGYGAGGSTAMAANTLLGSYTGTAITSGSSNTIVGANSGMTLTTGSNNILIGAGITPLAATGSGQLSIGNAIYGDIGSGTGNINKIGINVTSPTANLEVSGTVSATRFVGDGSGLTGAGVSKFASLTDVSVSVAAGNLMGPTSNLVGTANTNQNTSYGIKALSSPGLDNLNLTAVGYAALASNTTGDENTAVGSFALSNVTTGGWNTAVGSGALYNISSSSQATAVGYNALNYNAAGVNTAVGSNAIRLNVSGTNNAALGNATLYSNTTGSQNTTLGASAGRLLVSGSSNTMVGYYAGGTMTSGNNNIVIGALTVPFSLTGSHQLNLGNAIWGNIGSGLGNANRIGINVTSPTANLEVSGTVSATRFVGDGSGLTNLSAGNGDRITSGTTNVTANNNGAISFTTAGTQRMVINSAGEVGIGGLPLSGHALSITGRLNVQNATGNNTFIGNGTGGFATGTYNLAIGTNALAFSSNDYSTAVGNSAGQNNTGSYSVFFGNSSGASNGGNNITAVGNQSAQNNKASYVTAIGTAAVYSNLASGTTAFGAQALNANTTGLANTAAGYQSLQYVTTGNNNTAFGYATGSSSGSSSGMSGNTLFGSYTGNGLTTGNSNTIIGSNSGMTLSTGAGNILIGAGITPLADTGSYQLSIGNAIFGNIGSGIGNANRIGINVTSPTANLEISGTVSATRFVGDGSGLTNLNISGDRITSGSTSVIATSTTGIISLTNGGTTWGYFGSAASYLPFFNSTAISSTLVSATNVSASVIQLAAVTGSAGISYTVAGTTTLASLTDVALGTLTSGSVLTYNGGTSKWNALAASTGLTDRITSGTTSVVVTSASSIISLTTGVTTWGYFGSTASYLPYLGSINISSTLVSSTNISSSLINAATISSSLVSATNVSATFIQLQSMSGSAGVSVTIAGGADNLGNHTATQDLTMATFNITGAGTVSATGNIKTTAALQSGNTDTTCSTTADYGKMRFDSATGKLYLCRP